MAELNENYVVCEYERGTTRRDFIREKVEYPEDRQERDDGFLVFDFGDVIAKHRKWKELLPRVRPFYAVKCRPYTPILKVMNALDIGFDCASKLEIESVLNIGVDPNRIVYSHTRKQVSTLEYAANNNVDLVTFDDENELMKIKRVFPSARLLLRFALYDPTAKYPQGLKYGCKRETALILLQLAKTLKLNVVGIHFHIGTESKKPSNYQEAIAYSRELFDVAEKIGFQMSILDIGGGFPGHATSTGKFNDYAKAVSEAIDEYFPESCKVDIMAEPGTYYMKSAVTVVACIIGKRQRTEEDAGSSTWSNKLNATIDSEVYDKTQTYYDYYLNEGRYTSFCNAVYEPIQTPQPVKDISDKPTYSGTIYGYTCCETDVIILKTSLPEMDEGDWLLFKDLGNYTHLVTYFNGFKRPFCYYAIPDNCRQLRHVIEDNVTNHNEAFNGNDLLPEDLSLLE
ncbi:ornithine decarboxylase 1-like isoform X2 [Amphiura filiformis]|uniref:ornithine decarboxylase 1-like isoform X2 n=1 Tax=Amphiura filiformis TaxID=82378 RepID=UPI003B210404